MNGNGLLLRSLTSSLSPCTLKGDLKSKFSTTSMQHDHEEEIFLEPFLVTLECMDQESSLMTQVKHHMEDIS